MKYFYSVIVLIATFIPWISTRRVNFFRRDYTYFENFDAYYKLHYDVSGQSWDNAFLTCDDEGASLFYPTVGDEWTIVKNLTLQKGEVLNVSEIFVGLHDKYRVGEFITVDGHPPPTPLNVPNPDTLAEGYCVLLNIETGLYNISLCEDISAPRPFVCRRLDIETCPTIDGAYRYYNSTKKCYKAHESRKNCKKAMRTCYNEGGILAVIENVAENQALQSLLRKGNMYFVGLRKINQNTNYYTVNGQNMNHVYQAPDLDSDACGIAYVTQTELTPSTRSCDMHLAFVCELEI